MFNIRVSVPIDELDANSRRYAEAPALMAFAWKRNMSLIGERMLTRLRVVPGPPPPGITRLMTPRQRRAFFATDGFGSGIPHQRTDAVPSGWQQAVEADRLGGSATIFNLSPAAFWAEWYGQQAFHRAIGWLYAPPLLDEYVNIGVAVAEDSWLVVNSFLEGAP